MKISAADFKLTMPQGKRAQPEMRLQRRVVEFLDAELPVDVTYYCAIPNGARTSAREGARLKYIGMKPGAPDILVWFDSRTLAIELKSEIGKLSPEQKSAHARLRKAGVTVVIARSVFDVRAALEACGVPLREELAA